MSGDEVEFTFYRYRPGDQPYRRTPSGRFEQYSLRRGGWWPCNQNDNGLTRISPLFLPHPARGYAYAPAVDQREATR